MHSAHLPSLAHHAAIATPLHCPLRRYFTWWWITIFAVAFTVWYEPYVMAFAQHPGLVPPWGVQAFAEYLMIGIFASDMLVTFFVAYYDNEVGGRGAGGQGDAAGA